MTVHVSLQRERPNFVWRIILRHDHYNLHNHLQLVKLLVSWINNSISNQETHTTKKAVPRIERKRPKSTRNAGLITWRWEQLYLYLIQTNFQKRKLISRQSLVWENLREFVQKQWQSIVMFHEFWAVGSLTPKTPPGLHRFELGFFEKDARWILDPSVVDHVGSRHPSKKFPAQKVVFKKSPPLAAWSFVFFFFQKEVYEVGNKKRN